MQLNKFFIILFFGLLVTPLLAQDLPTGEVEIVKNFNAQLANAERHVVNPQLPEIDTATKSRMYYNLTNRALEVQYLPPKIRPRSLQQEALADIYQGYLKAGVGFPQSLLLEGSYDITDSNSPLVFGIEGRHQSLNNDSKVENQKEGQNYLELNGTYYGEQGYAVTGTAGYSYDVLHFYGYNDLDDDFASELSYAEEDVKQKFNTVYLQASLENTTETVGDIDYFGKLDFYNLTDNYSARETGFIIDAGATKWLNKRDALSVELITDFTSYKDTLETNLNNFFLKPSYTYHGDRFRVKVGVNLASHDDEFFIYPNIEGAANIVENVLTAFVGAEGGMTKNNFRNLTDYNPYLSSRNRIKNSFYNNFYGGIKGEYRGFDYQAQVSYKDVDNLALFQTNTDSIPRFNVLYDTASVITLSGQILFPIFDYLDIRGSIAQRFYSLDREDEPWHLPSTTLNVGAIYRGMDDKLKVTGELFVENGVPYYSKADDEAKSLNALFDVSVGAEYLFTEKIGGFVQLNNLAGNKRQRWRHYPTVGINVMAGVTARF